MITPYSNIISVTTLEALLLDTYTGAAAAYSLRKLSATYTGSAIKVRRSVGSPSEKDIGFVNNELDVADLESFCSGTDGFVVTWYDQSGNGNDASNTTASEQPQIVSSGSVILENAKPAIDFNGSDILTLSSISYTNISTIAVAKTTSIPSSNAHVVVQSVGVLLKSGQNPNNYPRFQPYDSGYKTAEYQVDSENQQLLLFGYTSSGNAYIYVNNNVGTSASISTLQSPANPFHIGLFPSVPNTSNNGPIQEVIIYPSDQSSNRTGIETNINTQYQIYWDGSQTSLLDTYGGSAAAYSLRALSSAYTGPLVRVRRASDNTEQDIYAKYDGTLNTEALEAFCASTDGFVKTWYDQSGNGYDVLQTTASEQPQIVNSGSVILGNSKPTLDFDGIDDYFIKSGLVYTTNNVFCTAVITDDSSSTFAGVVSQNTGGTGRSNIMQTDGSTPPLMSYFFNNGTSHRNVSNTAVNNLQQTLVSCYSFDNDYYTALDGNSANSNITNIAFTPNATHFSIGRQTFGGNTWSGYIQEVIVYNSDQSSNRTGIETNINDFYSIY